jgi:hypothetical protein
VVTMDLHTARFRDSFRFRSITCIPRSCSMIICKN